MRTKLAEWSGILSFLYLVGDYVWKFPKEIAMSLLFEIVILLILVGSLVIVFREKYKELISRFDVITQSIKIQSEEFAKLKEWVMFKEYDDPVMYSSLDHKIKVLVGKRIN